jgi:hypothetical protein
MATAAALVFSRFQTILGESLYGDAQPHIILYFVGVLVIAITASASTWRLREGLAKSIATAAELIVLGALVVAVFAVAVYLLFSLVPTF